MPALATTSTDTRPHLLRAIVAAALAAAIALTALVAPAATQAVGGSEFVRLANEYRASQGLGPVSLHAAVDQVAVERADHMAATRTFAHDMTYVKSRLQQLGVCWTNVGEIIAWESGYPTQSYARTMSQWINSSGHRAIIVGDFSQAGGSWTKSSNGKTYSIMIFVKLCGSSTSTANKATIGRVWFAAGSHTGVKFSNGSVVSSKTATLAKPSGADAGERRKISGKTYLYIVNGIWAGYWIPEGYRSYVPGIFDKVEYAAPVRLGFGAGTHTGYRYDSAGTMLARKAYTLYRQSGADATHVAIVNGRRHFLVMNGVWAGYWVPDTASVWPVR